MLTRRRVNCIIRGVAPGLETLVGLWLDSYASANTRAAYGGELSAFSRWCLAQERVALTATTEDVAAYLAWSEAAGASNASLARRRSALASFFGFACRAGAREANPVGAVASQPTAEGSSTAILDDDDATALLRASDRLGPKSAALVRMLMLDGLKLGELVAADATAFRADTSHGSLVVDRQQRRGPVRLSAPTVRRLQEYLGRRRRGPLLLSDMPGRQMSRLTRFGADYLLKEVARAARLGARISANTLRRRYVAAAAGAGAHVDDIRDQLGHRDARTTRRYLEPDVNATMPSRAARPERR